MTNFTGKLTGEIMEMAKDGLTICLEDEWGTHKVTFNNDEFLVDGKPEPITTIGRWLGYKKAYDFYNTYFDGYTI